MFNLPMTQEVFDAKIVQLKNEGVQFSNTESDGGNPVAQTGTLSKSGVEAEYRFDGEQLTVTAIKTPFLVSKLYAEGKMRDWLTK
jgi:hypothetical protein